MIVCRLVQSTILMLTLAGCAASPGSAQNTLANVDYAFRIRVPPRTVVCVAQSGDHPHGLLWNIDGSDCHENMKRPGVRAVGIWADYNTSFVPRADQYLATYCNPAQASRARTLSIGGLDTFLCVHSTPAGQLGADVAAGRGVWSTKSRDPEDRTPNIYYRAWLLTDRTHAAGDFKTFNRFVSSIELTPLPKNGKHAD
jgi:hypothetical protein